MTTECPLTCYICGKTSSDWITVDMIGLFKEQESAGKRFEEKHNKEPESYLFVCSDCEDKNPFHAQNAREKYGVYD